MILLNKYSSKSGYGAFRQVAFRQFLKACGVLKMWHFAKLHLTKMKIIK